MIGCGHADERMACGIADRIRLGLDDPTAGSVATVIANEHFADEKTRELDRVLRQFRTTQPAKTGNRGRGNGVAWTGRDALALNRQSLCSRSLAPIRPVCRSDAGQMLTEEYPSNYSEEEPGVIRRTRRGTRQRLRRSSFIDGATPPT